MRGLFALAPDGKRFSAFMRMPLEAQFACPQAQAHLDKAREKHRQDLIASAGEAHLPESRVGKSPNAPREWPWQFVFSVIKPP